MSAPLIDYPIKLETAQEEREGAVSHITDLSIHDRCNCSCEEMFGLDHTKMGCGYSYKSLHYSRQIE